MESAARRLVLLCLAVAGYTVVTGAFMIVERPGLGIGHFYYVPIALVAFASGPLAGAAGGVLAAALYAWSTHVNPHLPSSLGREQTVIRLVTFVAVGVLVGVFARRNRSLVEELSQLAKRDAVTGLPNTRAFESAIERRLELGEPFVLLVGDIDELRRLNAEGRERGDEALRRLSDRLMLAKRPDDDVARVGGDEFAILANLDRRRGRAVALGIEQHLSLGGDSVTFGWATYPGDGENALALYRAADERLYARKVARGFRRGPAQEALTTLV